MFARHLAACICGCFLFSSLATAQQSVTAARPYDGIQAGLDAYRLGEEQRQAGVGQQLFLNDTMRFWNGYPTSGVSNIYYGYMSPAAMQAYGYGAPLMPRASLDYLYGYNGTIPWGAWQSPGGALSVFQPWPYIPGDIWGYRAYYQPARQPIGQQQLQLGPNHWESHPIYNPPLTSYQSTPPVQSPLLDGTPYATPRILPPTVDSIAPPPAASTGTIAPPPPPRRVPREY